MEQGKYTYSSFACIFVILFLAVNFGREICFNLSGDSYRLTPPFPTDRVIGGDFQCYYYMAMRVRYGLPLYEERKYNDPRQSALAEHYRRMLGPLPEDAKRWMVRVQPMPWNHPPLAACIFVPFTFVPHPLAYRVYLGLLVAALVASLGLLGRYSRHRIHYWMIAAALIAFSYPLLFQLERGTSESFALLLVTLSFVLWEAQAAAVWVGLCIALAGHLKVYPFLLLYYFLLQREWRVCASVVIFCLILVLVSAACSREGLSAGIAQYGKLYRFVRDVYLTEHTWAFAGNHSTYSFLAYLLDGWKPSPTLVLGIANALNVALVVLASIAVLIRKGLGLPARLMDYSLIIVLMMVIPAAANDYSLVMLYFAFAASLVCFERLDFRAAAAPTLFLAFALTAALIFIPALRMPIGDGPSGGYLPGLWFLSNKWTLLMALGIILWLVKRRLGGEPGATNNRAR